MEFHRSRPSTEPSTFKNYGVCVGSIGHSGTCKTTQTLGKKEAATSCRENPDKTVNGQPQPKAAAERENSLRRKLPGSSLAVANKYPPQTFYATSFNQSSFSAAMKLIPSLFSSSSSKQRSPSSSDSNRSVDSLSKPSKRSITIGRNASCLDAEYWTPPADLLPGKEPKKERKVSKEDLEQVLSLLGHYDHPSEEELSEIISDDEFAPDDLKEAFRTFDADGDGKISAEELRGVFLTLGDERCSIEDCRGMIRSVDSSGDGFVCFDDFVRMMTEGREKM